MYKKGIILKEACVLLIAVFMVLTTVLIVGGDSVKKSDVADTNDYIGVKSIQGSEIFRQLFERYTMTCIPVLGFYRTGDTFRGCISADGGISWYMEGSGSEDIRTTGCFSNDFILSEGFEGGIMPPTGWSVSNLGTDAWTITDSAHSGNYAVEHISTGGMGSLLTSPMLNCSSVSSLFLEFWYSITDAEPFSLMLGIYSEGWWVTLDPDFGETETYTHYKIDITHFVSSEVKIEFNIGDFCQSTVCLDDIKLYDGGTFIGDVDPIGGDTEVTEIPDGYVISGTDEYGALFDPNPSYKSFTNTIDLNDISLGGKIGMKYFTLEDNLMFEIEIGHEIDVNSKFSPGIHPVGFNGSASGAPSIIGSLKGKKRFEKEIIDGKCGAFKKIDKFSSPGIHPVGFNGSASGAPSIIDITRDNDEPFEYEIDGETYVIDSLKIQQVGHPPKGIQKCSVTKTDPSDLSSNTMTNGEFTVEHVRASDPPDIPDINGSTSGKAGEKQTYTISTIEPNGDNVCYFIEWGDDSGEWTTLYGSNDVATVEHIWDVKGDYTIKVKAKDIHGFESDWETLTVSMPKNKVINTALFLQRFFQRFPLFEKILNQIISIN